MVQWLTFFCFISLLFLHQGCTVTSTKVFLIYCSWIHTLHHFPLSPFPWILGIISKGLIFQSWVHNISTTFNLLHTFLISFPILLVPTPQTGPLFLKKKKRHFCVFKIALYSDLWWHFHVYAYCNLNWFISPIFLLSTLALLMVISTGLKILYSFLYRNYINHIHHLNFLLLPSLSH
jgi:hypothetical protein